MSFHMEIYNGGYSLNLHAGWPCRLLTPHQQTQTQSFCMQTGTGMLLGKSAMASCQPMSPQQRHIPGIWQPTTCLPLLRSWQLPLQLLMATSQLKLLLTQGSSHLRRCGNALQPVLAPCSALATTNFQAGGQLADTRCMRPQAVQCYSSAQAMLEYQAGKDPELANCNLIWTINTGERERCISAVL